MPGLLQYLPNEQLKANKKMNKRDKARVKSGEPSASSVTDTKSLDSVLEVLDLTKNELVMITDRFTTARTDRNQRIKIEFGNILNLLTRASKGVASLKSGALTTGQINELQTYYNDIQSFTSNFQTEIAETQARLADPRNIFIPDVRTDNERSINFGTRMVTALQKLLGILNSKLLAGGQDVIRRIDVEVSGINAPVEPIPSFALGSGRFQVGKFATSWVLERGAPQYQNQEYI
jgi:hypothetical protein